MLVDIATAMSSILRRRVVSSGQRRAGVSVPHGRTSGAEARLLFPVLIGTSGTRALPGVSRAGLVEGTGKRQQQIPHRAFGPVRNDKGSFWVALRGAEAPLFHSGAGGGGDLVSSRAESTARSKSKAADEGVRSTRARSTSKATDRSHALTLARANETSRRVPVQR
jgi:hypothetical protein